MEALLERYAEPLDPQRPVICLDEYPYALQSTPRGSLPLARHRPRREDSEFARHGRCSLFALFQPATGWREILVLERRTRLEFAQVVRHLVTEHFPDAHEIRLVLDNLNTHTPAAFSEAWEPALARELARHVSFHYTPKHGRWLNMVEIELAVLARECLSRRLPDIPTVQREVDAWAAARNAAQTTVHWHFTATDARRWLERCYPDRHVLHPA